MSIAIERRLECAAIVLARELNLGRAARVLHVTIPILDTQIRQLENKFGRKLFRRDLKGIQLTEAGKNFLANLPASLPRRERKIPFATGREGSANHVILVGCSPDIDPRLISTLLSIRLPHYSNFRVQLHSDFVSTLILSLLTNEIDMALVTRPRCGDGLTLVPVTRKSLHVLLPKDHPAAERDEIVFEDIANDPWIVFNREAHPSLYDGILKRARVSGIEPRRSHHFIMPEEAFHLVGEGAGIAFVANAAALSKHHSVVVVKPMADVALQVVTYFALRGNEASCMVHEYARAFLQKAEGPKHPGT